jgi:hypothetical protein
VACGDLDVAEVDLGVEHGGDVGVAEHVWVHSGELHAGVVGQVPESAGGGVPVHPAAPQIPQHRPGLAFADGAVDGAPRPPAAAARGRPCCPADHPQDAVAVLLADVGDVGGAGFEDA